MITSSQQLEIQIWPIDRLIFYARNPRKNDAAVDRMCSSMREFGLKIRSGATLAAAELTERVCCGIELDPKYVDVIVPRWQTLSGKKAKLDGDWRTFEEIATNGREESA